MTFYHWGLKVFLPLFYKERAYSGDFPGGPVVKTLSSTAGGVGLIPGQGAKVPHASRSKKKKKSKYKSKAVL